MIDDRIAADCPECRSRYHLRADLLGRKMRCTNPNCRNVFTVGPADDLPAPEFDWRDEPPAAPVVPIVFAPPAKRPTSWRPVMAVLAAASIAVIAGGAWFVVKTLVHSEASLRAEADAAYADGRYRESARLYGLWRDRVGDGPKADEAKLLVELSEVRWLAGTVPPDPGAALARVPALLETTRSRPEYHGRAVDVAAVLGQILDALTAIGLEAAADAGGTVKAEQARVEAATALDLLKRAAPELVPAASAKLDRLDQRIEQQRQALDVRRRALALLASGDWSEAGDLIRRHDLKGPDIDAAWKRAADAVRGRVRFVANKQPPGEFRPTHPGGFVPGEVAADGGETIPAIAGGILYALDARTGRCRWVKRIGGDFSPLTVEALWITATTDPAGVAAIESHTGRMKWFQPTEAKPIGPPVTLGGLVAVALDDDAGRVIVTRLDTGERVGHFPIGRRVAGLAADGSRLVVVADADQMIALTTDPLACEMVWSNGHAAGAVRGLAARDGRVVVADLHLGATRWRSWRLSGEAVLTGEARLPGWSWGDFALDAERLVALTDAGSLGVFAGPRLVPLVEPLPGSRRTPVGRSQLGRADEHRVWGVAGDELHLWRLALDRVHGRRLVPSWSVAVGSPSRISEAEDGRLLTVVGVPLAKPVPLATAIDSHDGRVMWQRPLGLASGGEWVVDGDRALTVDATGRVWKLPAEATPPGELRPLGRELFGPVADVTGLPRLARAGDRVVSLTASGTALTIRRVRPLGGETTVSLPAAVAGPAEVGDGSVIVPLANGLLARVPLDRPAKADLGPSWRSPGHGDVIPQVAAVGGGTFVISDGRRLTRLTWPADGPFRLDADRALSLPGRITVVGGQVLVADERRVSRIDPAAMSVSDQWPIDGDITAGPFALGERTFAAVIGSRLAAWEFGRGSPVWWWELDSPLAGPPRVEGESVIVATRTGVSVIDRATGHARAVPVKLPNDVTIAATPVAVGSRWVVPLSDGSVIVVNEES